MVYRGRFLRLSPQHLSALKPVLSERKVSGKPFRLLEEPSEAQVTTTCNDPMISNTAAKVRGTQRSAGDDPRVCYNQTAKLQPEAGLGDDPMVGSGSGR